MYKNNNILEEDEIFDNYDTDCGSGNKCNNGDISSFDNLIEDESYDNYDSDRTILPITLP